MPNFLINVTSRGVKGTTRGIKRLSGSLLSLSKVAMVGAAGGAVALGVAMKKATSAAAEQELAEKKLEAAFGKNIDGLKIYAQALQQQTMFGDEAILSAQAMLGSFVKDEEQMKLATQATLDLAAAKGMDLNAAADLVGKSFGSSTNALTRYGVEAEGAAGSSERLESLTKNVATLFGGQAKAQAQTMAGAMQQAKNAIGDAAEALGDIVAPLATAGAAMTKEFAEKAEDAFDALGQIDFGATFENMKTNMGALQTLIVDSFKLSFGFIPDLFMFAINKIWPLAKKALGVLWEGIKAVSAFLWEPIGIGIQIVIAKVKNFFIGMVNFAKEQFNTLADLANTFGANIQPMELSKLIDTEGLSMSNAKMVQILKEGSEDNINTLGDFTQQQLEIYQKYSDSVIVNNKDIEESEKSKAVAVKSSSVPINEELGKTTIAANLAKSSVSSLANEMARLVMEGKSLMKIKPGELIGQMVLAAGFQAGVGKLVSPLEGLFSALGFGHSGGLITNSGQVQRFQTGGIVGGGDNVPIVAQGGEFIMQRSAVNRIGVGNLQNMNQGGGGALTINLSGNVLTSDFVSGELADKISEAVRRGTDFGL